MARLTSSLRRACLAGLSSTWWSEARNHRMETVMCWRHQVRAQDGVLHFFARLRKTNTASRQEIRSKNGLAQLFDDCPDTRRELATNTRAVVNNIRKEPRTSGRRGQQRHTSASRFHETRRKATGGTQRCGQERRQFARPHHRPSFLVHDPDHTLSALPRPAPSAPGAWTLPPASAPSPPEPPEFHHVRPRKRRCAGSVSLNSLICRATCRRRDGAKASPAAESQ